MAQNMDNAQMKKNTVTQKILETTRETEKLKQELEALIASGIRGRSSIVPSTSQITPIESSNKVQIIKSYDPKHSQRTKKPSDPPAVEPQALSPKKPKTYNVEEAREYIKRQRGKRMDELKNKKSYTQISAEIRKEKLQELQLKANEIVKKNVEAKKSRSRSREPPIVRSRSGNREQAQQGFRSRSQSADKRPAAEESVIEAFNCAVKTRQHLMAPSSKKQVEHQSRSSSRRAVSVENLHTDCRYNLKRADASDVRAKKKNPNLLHPPEPVYGLKPLKELERGKTKSASVDDIADKPDVSATTSKVQKPVEIKVVDQKNISQAKPKINVLQNITLREAPNSSSTQVENQKVPKHTPDWLKEQPQTDPYNFINTVKRQLKYAVNERKPSYVDIGIQLEDMSSAPASGKSSKKTDLKSFISHKCLNLDPKVIEHIALDGPTVTKPSSCSENDSDTSKNIPSISSESCSSLRRNAEFIRQSYAVSDLKPLENAPPNLNAKKVEDIRLNSAQNLLAVPEDEVQRIKKQLFKDSESYSSDFPATDLSKSRNSIISFNCAKVSPNKVPLFMPEAQQVANEPSEDSNKDSEKNNAFLATESVNKPSEDSSVTKNITTSRPSQKRSVGESKNLDSLGSSLKYTSLLSTLRPSTNEASSRKSGSLASQIEQTETVESQKVSRRSGAIGLMSQSDKEIVSKNSGTVATESRRDDGIIELLRAKGSFTGSETSHKTSSEPISEAIKSATSKESLDSYKTKSDNVTLRKKNKETKGIFSKSESNIYANKENMAEPKLSLNITKRNKKADSSDRQALMRNITIRSADQSRDDLNNTNEIHLKFEAEIHLLTDFNKSIRRLSEIEKEFEDIRARNSFDSVPRKVLQNRDTQTSKNTTSLETTTKHSKSLTATTASQIRSDSRISKRSEIKSDSDILLDLTQASDLTSALTSVNFEDSLLNNISDKTSSVVQFSQLDLDTSERGFGDENAVFKGVVGMSLRMFDQLIKDEDARIENLKKVLKIREQALLDRTRGELVWLEMQKKQLIETGKLSEASLIKKKQRGILLKHQQEKHEMQRLKQMQKEDSHKRKTLLRKERNQIKNQLLSDMLPKLKRGGHRERNERRLSGPLKVIQTSGTTTVHSETSLSKGTAGTDQEIKSITTRTSRTHSVVNILSETSDNINTDVEPFDFTLRGKGANISGGAVSSMKKTLLMREQALAKRRKTVEELLQWHRKLLDEEKAIEDLESKIGTIISKIPSKSNEKKLQQSISEHTEPTSAASMSQLALEILQPPATSPSKTTSISTEQPTKNIPQEEIHSEDSNRVVSSANYSTDFDIESAPQNSDDQSSVSSISQLIENFSKIEDHLLNLNLMPQKPNDDKLVDEAKSEVSSHSTEAVQSQIEAQKDADASVIVVEPSEHLSEPSDQDKVIEIASEVESHKSDSDKEPISEQLATNNVPGDITNSSSIVELVEDKELLNEETSEENASEEQVRTSNDDLTKTSAVSEEVEPEIVIVEETIIEASERSLEPQTTETEHISSQVIDVESKASTDHEEVLQTQSEAPASSPTKDVEEIEIASNLEQPSTSRQDNSSLSLKEDITNLSEEKDHDSLSSPSSPSLENEAQPPSVVEDDRHSFENKTDEEKAASLSGRSNTNQKPESNSSSRVSTEEAASSTSVASTIEASVNAENSSKPSEEVSEESNTSGEVSTITSPKTASKSSKTSSGSSDKPVSVQKAPTKSSADIKKHVQDILNVSSPRGDKSPRMQDLCLITYDTSPVQSPESGSPMDERKPFSLGTEAEELHRKQLAIEQEIKLLKEQQQKEAASLYIREIPNKPPPPYTPPSKTKAPKTPSIVPGTRDEIEQITEYSAKIIHKAYMSGNLDNIIISDNTLNLIAKNIDKGCYKYVFDLCKEIARDHYGQFVEEAGPSWLRLDRKPVLTSSKPLDVNGLKRLMSRKLFEMFGVDKQETKVENAIMKWSRKKRDPVDEVLLQEMQAEETTWTNFDRDEAFVKDRITNEIMEMLLKETAKVLKNTMQKKMEGL